jgi:hypothetical protein
MSILSHIKGAVKGFASGGFYGAIAGGVMGQNNGVKSTMRPPTNPNIQSVGQFSANPMVRYAASPGVLQPIPVRNSLQPGPGGSSFAWSSAGPMQTLGFTNTSGMAASGQPMWAHRRLYTKKGTPRRTRADGMPYSVPRMNPMNPRAARRAVRRIKGARKLLQRIERTLPRAHTRRRAA